MAKTVLIRDTEADPQQSFVAGEQLLEARDPVTGFLWADLLLDLAGRVGLRVYDGTIDEVVVAQIEVLAPDAGATGIRILSGTGTPVTLIAAGGQSSLTLGGDGAVEINGGGSAPIIGVAVDGTVSFGDGGWMVLNPDFTFLLNGAHSLGLDGDGVKIDAALVGTRAAAVADVVGSDPADIATTLNALLASMRTSGELAT